MTRLFQVVIVGCLCGLTPAGAAVWIVDQGGGEDATTIQGAVDLAAPGDQIQVHAGTYPEMVVLDKELTIFGAGATSTIIDAEGTRSHTIRSNGPLPGITVLNGLTFTGVNAGYGFCTGVAAVEVQGPMNIIDCVVENNHSLRATVDAGGFILFNRTRFSGNNSGPSCGITDPEHATGCVRAAGEVVFYECVFEDNRSSDNSICDVGGGSDAIFHRCTFNRNSSSGGMFVASTTSGGVGLYQCLFLDNNEALFSDVTFYGGGRPVRVQMFECTVARNSGFFQEDPFIRVGSEFRNNVFTGANVGFRLPDGGSGFLATCNDAWGNGTDFVGFDPVPGGNFSAAPLYCAPEFDDFTVASNSILLAGNNGCGLPIGAFGEGCGPISIEGQSWGKVKSLYR